MAIDINSVTGLVVDVSVLERRRARGGPPFRDVIDDIVDQSRQMGALAAARYRSAYRMRAEAYASQGHGDPSAASNEMIERALRLEVACALRITEYAAEALIGTAMSLVTSYPHVLKSLEAGRVTDQHVGVMLKCLTAAPIEVREALAAPALALAEQYPVGVFRKKLKELIEQAQEAGLDQRYEQAVEGRRVDVVPQGDGMSVLEVVLPAVEAQAVYERVTRIATHLGQVEGETRTRDQLRADVICDLLIDGDTASNPAQARGIQATVVVTVPALSLLEGFPEDAAGGSAATAGGAGSLPGARVEGVGPIPISRARRLCGGAKDWMRVLTHPETGMVLSVGRDRYRPPAALRKLVTWSAGTCMAPGCVTPATRCEIDHRIAYSHGGQTSADNLGPLCTGHHTVKHHGNWRTRLIPDSGGVVEWTSPNGRRYLVEPERRIPAFSPADQRSPF